MPAFPPATTALHEALRQCLAAHCLHGRFDISETGAHLSLSGRNAAGHTRFFWDFDRPFRQLVGDYLAETHDAEAAQLTILLDMEKAEFQCARTTRQQVAAEQAANEKLSIETRRTAPRDRTPYGPNLAAQVAARLAQGAALHYSHRDYCGQGLGRNQQGEYLYGEVWDGGLQPDKVFPTQADFVRWLAVQSDYTLACLEYKDPWAWDNQTVTRRRLVEFVG